MDGHDSAHPCQRKRAESALGRAPRGRFGVGRDHIGGLLRDHDGRRVGVAGDQGRHDRSVDNAQAGDAVKAENRRTPSPGLSALRGWIWNWTSGVSSSGRVRAKIATSLAAIVSGPVRLTANLMPIITLRSELWAWSLNVIGRRPRAEGGVSSDRPTDDLPGRSRRSLHRQ